MRILSHNHVLPNQKNIFPLFKSIWLQYDFFDAEF